MTFDRVYGAKMIIKSWKEIKEKDYSVFFKAAWDVMVNYDNDNNLNLNEPSLTSDHCSLTLNY